MSETHGTEAFVRRRYAAGAIERADRLRCPINYKSEYLKIVPREVIERDYGCGPCFERNQAVIYRGPFKQVLDSDDDRVERGKCYAVCDKTYNLYKKALYRDSFEFIDPIVDIPLETAKPFDYSRTELRHPKQIKAHAYNATTEANNKCCDSGTCC